MDNRLIEKYLNGTATPQQAEEVLEWLQTEEGQHYLSHRFELDIEQLEEIEVAFERPESPYETLNNVEVRIDRREQNKRIRRMYRRNSVLAVAACITFLVAIVSLVESHFGLTSPDNVEQPVTIVIHTTGFGEQKIIQLSDGTAIRLNENSRLEMPEYFDKGERDVRLQGQAYFDVAHDKERPFRVFTGDAMVRVLGTAFNVKEAERLDQIQVAVTEGRVSLGSQSEAEQEPVILEPNMIGLFDRSSQQVESETSDVNNYLSWIHGRVVYDRAPFREVIQQLERIYEISSVVKDDELYDLRLTADFSERSFTNVLEVIAHSLEIEFTMRGDVVEWRSRELVPGA